MKKMFTTLLILLTISSITLAQDLWGPLSGIIESGIYHVIGNSYVSEGDSLTIEPGTIFYFDGEYEFDIYGYLYAVGTEEDSIKFMQNPGSDAWYGIDFDSTASDSSRLEYCYIGGSDGLGIYIYSCSPTITRCTIYGCNAGCG